MKYAKRQFSSFELCLCPSCAAHYYHSPTKKIRRTDPLQLNRDLCDCCRTRRGFDFTISSVARKAV